MHSVHSFEFINSPSPHAFTRINLSARYINVFFPDVKFERSERGQPPTRFEWCCVARLYCSVNWKQQVLGELIEAPNNFSTHLRHWVARWGQCERIMCNKIITKPLLLSHQPAGFSSRYPKPIATLVDGTVIAIDTARTVTLQQRATYNNKASTNAAQAIGWVSPCGLGMRNTSLFGGRLSEEACVWLHHLLLRDFPAGWARLVDKVRSLQAVNVVLLSWSLSSSSSYCCCCRCRLRRLRRRRCCCGVVCRRNVVVDVLVVTLAFCVLPSPPPHHRASHTRRGRTFTSCRRTTQPS